ncbi:2-hydroxymuconic semialdehyde dehydrogenase [Aeromicrobium sp. 9AM]|uniref:2-hydroxymuconic semialdehyde dehydrogenase n=1 Tax=Aeromicrobium sp. 9AM TaxID=2653126 RepID=UPI0012F1FA78|nr:2-hydroxymuconic semialdehyde dehydrogenase [Aeromicrobium sp. 9AM]VXB07512.1 2-aminomuconic 6-semialdehyde dehydrogenase [Aeromicrobium sp. 9AM]
MSSVAPDEIVRNFVAGRFVDPDPTRLFDDVDPVTGRAVASVHEADASLVDRAVRSARNAVAGEWSKWSTRERAALLRRAALRIEERFEEFVEAEIRDTGKPITHAREVDVARAVANLSTFADVVSAAGESSFRSELPGGRQALNYVVRKPLGVVAVVVPWNLPLLLLTWKVAPALACGNAVVVKPSEETPTTATLLADVFREVGLPDGVYNVVHGYGLDSAGSHLVGHSGVDGVTFTGSTATGTQVMRAAATGVRPVSFELGGKNAAVVFADADLDATLDGLTRSVFSNTGQVCLCTERVYVQRSVFDDVVEGLADRAARLVLGDPRDTGTTTGPLISRAHRDKVLAYFALAEAAGARAVVGGGVPDLGAKYEDGAWIEPTLWVGMDNDARPMREEIFGPVAGLVPFDTDAEAISLANDSEYGLAASVWTSDLVRGHQVAQAMNVGMSWVNTWFLRDLRSPFGGAGLSGIGREGGESSLHFYTEPTNVCVQL